MLTNRSMPDDVLIPVLAYPSVSEAVGWLTGATVGDAEDHFYGERRYTATDFTGRTWIFTQSVADLDPTDWGCAHGSGGSGRVRGAVTSG